MSHHQIGSVPQGTVFYFGYGSNMKSSTMKSRGINVIDSKIVKVPSYVLTFDVFGLAYSEPSMASIARYDPTASLSDSIPDVHGIAFRITPADLIRVIETEGGGVAYKEVMLEGICLDDDEAIITMYTLVAKYPRRPNASPSRRYLVCNCPRYFDSNTNSMLMGMS